MVILPPFHILATVFAAEESLNINEPVTAKFPSCRPCDNGAKTFSYSIFVVTNNSIGRILKLKTKRFYAIIKM